MNIKHTQGINLRATTSIIEIDLKPETNIDIVEKIVSYHPIFAQGHTYQNNVLTIETKLPKLWIEIGKALQKLSNREWSLDYTNTYIMQVIVKKLVGSMSTIPLLHSAINQGLELTQYVVKDGIDEDGTNNRRYVVGAGSESGQICSFSSSKDSYVGFKIQRDKTFTNRMLDQLGIPSPKWAEIKHRDEIDSLWEQFTKPIVMKPAGLTGGNGVITRIETKDQAYKAFDEITNIINLKPRQKYQNKILIQEQVSGEDYRLLVIDGKFQIATKRIPAFVTGDGINNVSKLIEITNQDPRRDITNPTHTLKPIVIDDALTDFLKDQGHSLDYIPKKDEIVNVRKVASMSKGGITEDFTDKVHPQIKTIVEALASSIHTYVLGVDVFCKDITKPLTDSNGTILECNTMPEAYLNAFPTIGKQYNDIGDTFLSTFISKQRTKRIVAIGGDLKNSQSKLRTVLNISSDNIGIYSNNKIIINDEIFNDSINIMDAYRALKLNRNLNIILHHISNEEFKEYGSGFENIDILIDNSNDPEITKVINGYKNIGLILNII